MRIWWIHATANGALIYIPEVADYEVRPTPAGAVSAPQSIKSWIST
jgi:hypothetical protein